MTNTLTHKQTQFVSEYLIDMNATQAAIRAGYSEKTAQEQGSRLLSNVMVKAAIENGMNQSAERNQMTIDTITKMHLNAFDTAAEAKNGSAMTTAANNLAKLHGLIVTKNELSGSNGKVIKIEPKWILEGVAVDYNP